jgi:F-type H+-transporting ATPase subunit gamma
MPAQLQTLRRRIRTVKSTKKITKAQELVATSRIGKAQEKVLASRPYAETITDVLSALASNAPEVEHPLLHARPKVNRAGVLLITSDRGLAGGYNAFAIRTAEGLIARLNSEDKQVALYVIGRKGVAYYRFRNRPIEASWTGFSERPQLDDARTVAETVREAFVTGAQEDGDEGIDEFWLVSTQFRSLMTQAPATALVAPVSFEPVEGLTPAYEFEPGPEQLLDALLPKYLNTRIYTALLDSAASESASRRRAMKAATDNAEELLKKYTRDMNSARQASITQEISEIVGGANALAGAGSEG